MILTDKEIQEVIEKGIIKIDPFDPECLEPASYDFRVGAEGITTQGREKLNLAEKGLMLLEPGDFGVVSSLESIQMPNNYAARLGIRSYYSRQGLFAATGPQIDPGFKGRLFITVINLSPNPITLPYKEKLLTIEFHKLNQDVTKPYAGEFQSKLNMSDREIRVIIERKGLSFAEMIQAINAMNKSINQLTADVKSIKSSISLLAILLGSGLGIITILATIITISLALR